MEECEAISIMAGGGLRCIGSFLHLRSTFAGACTLRIQYGAGHASPHTVSGVISTIGQKLEEQLGDKIELVDSNLDSATISMTDRSVKRSVILRVMREFSQTLSNLG